MAAADGSISTWDIALVSGGPRRASLADVGGASVADEAPFPNKDEDPYADLLNQIQRQVAALNRTIAACGFSVEVAAGVPSVTKATACGIAVAPGTFTATHTGAGNQLIEWPQGTFPPFLLKPRCTLDTDVAACAPYAVFVPNSSAGKDGVRLKTRDQTGAAADANVTVMLT